MWGRTWGAASCRVLSRSNIQVRRHMGVSQENSSFAGGAPMSRADARCGSLLSACREYGGEAGVFLPAADERAHALVGEHFEQQGMIDPAVDDVAGVHAVLHRVERRAD